MIVITTDGKEWPSDDFKLVLGRGDVKHMLAPLLRPTESKGAI